MEEIIELLAMKIAKNITELLQDRACDKDVKQMDRPTCESYKIDEVCKRLKISKATLSRHRKAGFLKPSVYVGRSPRFTEEDIQEYLSKWQGLSSSNARLC